MTTPTVEQLATEITHLQRQVDELATIVVDLSRAHAALAAYVIHIADVIRFQDVQQQAQTAIKH